MTITKGGGKVEAAVPTWRVWARRFAEEPLTHFVIIGAAIFAVSVGETGPSTETQSKIIITDGDVRQMVFAWHAQGRADPSPAQLQSMLDEKVHEEVLYREALAMGLDKDDVIITRRLAQKMDFLAEDLSALREPTQVDLQTWLDAHPEDFALPPRVSFHHIYFSFDTYGPNTRAAAEAALADASQAQGDRFMFQDSYAERTPEDVAGVFGPAFAESILGLAPGKWSGPVESGYGWHLVFVDTLAPGRAPELAEVEDQVKAAWIAAQRDDFKNEAYKVMRAKYEVVLPDLKAGDARNDGGS